MPDGVRPGCVANWREIEATETNGGLSGRVREWRAGKRPSETL